MKIVITGFMGTGKTTIGKALAEKLSMDFIDTDEIIEKRESMRVGDIFEKYGEEYFRKREKEVSKSLENLKNIVIATGGKTLLFKKNLNSLLKNGVLITLKVNPAKLWERLKKDSIRPLLKQITMDKFISLYKEREKEYEKLPNKVDISNLEEKEALEKVLNFLTKSSGVVEIKVGENISRVYFERFLIRKLKEIDEFKEFRKIFLICDRKIYEIYKEDLKIFPLFYLIPGKDRSKNLKNAERIWKWLIRENIRRDSIIVSIGGGVVGDLAGFVSSTILRGVTHYHIPTTLLSMLDSSIGGKNGINFQSIKNAIGTINPPTKVFIDPLLLSTLSKKELSSGLVEGIKSGLIGDSEILDIIEGNLNLIKLVDIEKLEEIIIRSINVKKKIVEEDPYEKKGIRKFLNLGHTLAHAIESYSKYRISHGEAVGIGLIYSLGISEKLGIASSGLKERVKNIINNLQLRTSINRDKIKILELMRKDKKSNVRGIDFVLLKKIGEPFLLKGISEKLLLESLEEVINENPCD